MWIETPTLIIGEDILDVTEWLRRTPRTWSYQESVTGDDGYQWTLDVTYAQALNMSTTGWPEGVAKLRKGLDSLPHQERPRWRTTYDVSGHYGDLSRALVGDPLNMVSNHKRRAKSPITTLVLNMSANCNVPASHFVNLGIAFASAIDNLEDQGRRVELLLVHSSFVTRENVTHGWWVKKARDPLDLDQLAFAVAHPAAFRRIGFAMRERTDRTLQCPGYGYTTGLPKEVLEKLALPEDTVVFDASDMWRTDTATPEQAIAAVSRKLQAQGQAQ